MFLKKINLTYCIKLLLIVKQITLIFITININNID